MSFHSKEVLVKLGLAAGAITAVGCGDAKNEEHLTPTAVVRPIATAIPAETLTLNTGALPEEMIEKYPEFKDYIIKSAFKVSTPSGKETMFYNMTDYQPNQEAIESIYRYLENYLGNEKPLSFLLPNSSERIETMPSPILNKRATAILSDDLDVPKDGMSPYGQTGWVPKGKLGSTYIRLRDFGQKMDPSYTPQEGYTWIFAVEACQQTLFAFVVGKDGRVVENLERMFQAQEIVCNSIGAAISRRIHGETWQQYSDWLDTRGTLNIPQRNLYGAQIAKMDEETYNAMPQSGNIFK